MSYKNTIGIIGVGHVGLPTVLGFAELGYNVIGVDEDKEKISNLLDGKPSIFEPKIVELLNKHLSTGLISFTDNLAKAVKSCEVLFVCVGTPQKENGEADLSQVERVAILIAQNINAYKLIVEKSTVPIKTSQWIKKCIEMHLANNEEFDIASNPEFLQEGKAMDNFFNPDRIVIGIESKKGERILREIYKPFKEKLFVTNLNTAEMIKHASNSFLALKISFINMVSDLCDATDADIHKVAKGIGMDPRIGPSFLDAGIGYGGYCLPKDLRAFAKIGDQYQVDFSLLKQVDQINERRIDILVSKVINALLKFDGKTIGILGLSFKPNTDDIREAPSLKIIHQLLEKGYLLRLYDPQAMDNIKQVIPSNSKVIFTSSPYEAAEQSNALLILTNWDEFITLDFSKIKLTMSSPVIIDGRNCLNPEEIKRLGLKYYSMGRS